MNEPGVATKDPDATLDYRFDWTSWIPDGDAIDTATITTEGVDTVSYTHDATTATVWVTGGEPRTTARVTCRVHTAQGRVDDRTLTLHIHHR